MGRRLAAAVPTESQRSAVSRQRRSHSSTPASTSPSSSSWPPSQKHAHQSPSQALMLRNPWPARAKSFHPFQLPSDEYNTSHGLGCTSKWAHPHCVTTHACTSLLFVSVLSLPLRLLFFPSCKSCNACHFLLFNLTLALHQWVFLRIQLPSLIVCCCVCSSTSFP